MRLNRPHLLDNLRTVELILVDFIDYALNHTLRSAFSNGQLVISLFITYCTLNHNPKAPGLNSSEGSKRFYFQKMTVDDFNFGFSLVPKLQLIRFEHSFAFESTF